MAALDFLRRSRNVTAAFYHHGTVYCDRAEEMVAQYCQQHNLPLQVEAAVCTQVPKGQSQEEYWRNNRYGYLDNLPGAVVTAHTLDDVVETYLMGALHGTPKLIPHVRNQVIRPFLTTKKADLVRWAERYHVPWYECPSNLDTRHMRNHVRHNILPQALIVNPGLSKTVRKMVLHQNTVHLLQSV
jgi:tRNA(Ile)-lysidine synthase